MKEKFLLLAVPLLVVFGAIGISQTTLMAHVKAVLFVTEVFELPVRPLQLVTPPPIEERFVLDTDNGPVDARLFLPGDQPGSGADLPRPAIIIAMGVEPDLPELVIDFAIVLARLGYVVMWPHLEALDREEEPFEYPETFVQAITLLADHERVDPDRISIVGISVGAPIALVAAGDERVADDVRSIVYFGGYYDVLNYLVSLATGTAVVDGEVVEWENVSDEAIGRARVILEARNGDELIAIFDATTREEADEIIAEHRDRFEELLGHVDPQDSIDRLAARLFILHDMNDHFVHYSESIDLDAALPPDVERTFLLIDLFEHVQPRGLDAEAIDDVIALYFFLIEILEYL